MHVMLRSSLLPLATTATTLALFPRIGGLTVTFAMSKRPAYSSIVNPYLKRPPSLASTSISSASSSSSSSIANPYAKKREAPSPIPAAVASGARASSPIDLTSSPEASPVKKRKAGTERSSTSTSISDACAISTRSEEDPSQPRQQYKIYCDLDGVLVDFDSGILRATGEKPDRLPTHILWAKVASIPNFYENLGWMSDGKELWDAIKHMNPDILTGVPMAKKARAQKAAWCERELDMPTNHIDMAAKKKSHEVVSGRRSIKEGMVNIITCWSRNKHCESGRNAVLIDDRLSLQEDWVRKGGIFIHHTSTTKSLSELRRRGIL